MVARCFTMTISRPQRNRRKGENCPTESVCCFAAGKAEAGERGARAIRERRREKRNEARKEVRANNAADAKQEKVSGTPHPCGQRLVLKFGPPRERAWEVKDERRKYLLTFQPA
jgi:hypothetical protein